jgi:hypothetical protein
MGDFPSNPALAYEQLVRVLRRKKADPGVSKTPGFRIRVSGTG